MRIALFSDNFYPELSGISDSVIALAQELAKRGHYVDFYVPKYSKADYAMVGVPVKEIELGQKIRVIRFFSFPYRTGTGQGRLVIPIGLRAFKIFRSKPDVIHTQLFFGVGLEALFAARILRKPVIGTNHTSLKEFLKYSPVHFSWLDLLILKYMNWYYERCELVTAPSQQILDQMMEIGFDMAPGKMNARILSNPVVLPGLVSKEERIALREELGFSGPTIMYAGRFAREKNIDVLLASIAVIKKTIPDIILVLAGNGLIKNELEDLAMHLGIENNIRYLGVLSKPELGKLYAAADVCATASTSEAQSMTMLEAMAYGLPMVGVDTPGLREHINDQNGRLAKPNDPESLAREIIAVLKDEVLHKRLSDGGIAFAKQFSAESIAKEWEAVYSEVIRSYAKRTR